MHPESQRIISQIVTPTGTTPVDAAPVSTPMTIEQIVEPKGAYTGPERRAQGALIVEINGPVPEAPTP